MGTTVRTPGWDKKAVNEIAKESYGGLAEMFEAHGWSPGNRVISQIAPTRVVETYGSIESFVEAHQDGADRNPLLNPYSAIESDPPEVWLTSYYGFDPESWGLLPFGSDADRSRFLRRTLPGVLVVVYGTKGLRNEDAGKVLGVQQLSHVVGPSSEFIAPDAWAKKQASGDHYRWNFGVKCIRAWRIAPEFRPAIEEFADKTWSLADARAIGRYGKRLASTEALKLKDLPLFEVQVFGGEKVDEIVAQPASIAFSPSRPGPVSQLPHVVSEAEGPKHLYVLRMQGKTSSLLGYDAEGRSIYKVGFSVSPCTRRDAHNKALPACAFDWAIHRSTYDDEREPFPTSKHALAGEDAMKKALVANGKSLGGEFFLASEQAVRSAWKEGIRAAEEYRA